MIILQQDDAAGRVVVTLNEKKTLSSAYFLFVFTNVTTKLQVKWIVQDTADLSSHPSRYNEFPINVPVVFLNQQPGQWQYEVYEQASAVNTDPTGLTMVERGKLLLEADSNFSFVGYSPDTQYKGYAGQ